MCTYRDTSPTPGVPSYTHTPAHAWTCFLPILSHSPPRDYIPSSSALTAPPPPAPPLRKCSSGVPRAAQEMLCTLWVSQAIFCPRAGGRLGREQPGVTQSAVFCLFLCLSTLPSVLVCQSLCLLSVFLFRPQGLFDSIPFDTFHYCLHTLQILAQIHLFQKAFPDSYLIRTLPLCSQSSEQMPSEHWADELVSTSC